MLVLASVAVILLILMLATASAAILVVVVVGTIVVAPVVIVLRPLMLHLLLLDVGQVSAEKHLDFRQVPVWNPSQFLTLAYWLLGMSILA